MKYSSVNHSQHFQYGDWMGKQRHLVEPFTPSYISVIKRCVHTQYDYQSNCISPCVLLFMEPRWFLILFYDEFSFTSQKLHTSNLLIVCSCTLKTVYFSVLFIICICYFCWKNVMFQCRMNKMIFLCHEPFRTDQCNPKERQDRYESFKTLRIK